VKKHVLSDYPGLLNNGKVLINPTEPEILQIDTKRRDVLYFICQSHNWSPGWPNKCHSHAKYEVVRVILFCAVYFYCSGKLRCSHKSIEFRCTQFVVSFWDFVAIVLLLACFSNKQNLKINIFLHYF